MLLGNILAIYLHLSKGDANSEEILVQHLFRSIDEGGYNKWIRPVERAEQQVTVDFQLILRQLVDIDEKEQLMQTNVWLRQKWKDAKLQWNPSDYGNVTMLKLPANLIWTPDIVLMRNTDGNFTTNHATRAVIGYDGNVSWEPPGSFRSWCDIDVTYFPYDIQYCSMKFASWSYNGLQVKITTNTKKADLSRFLYNGEWEILENHMEEANCNVTIDSLSDSLEEVFFQPGITYYFIIRRLPLFYTAFLVSPCLGISFLTGLVFYLPAASQEKITLCTSVLLAHTFYLLVITEIIPSRANAIPLIAEYLLFTMIFITLSIILTTIVINVHYRRISTYRSLPFAVNRLALSILPGILCLEKFSGPCDADRKLTMSPSNEHPKCLHLKNSVYLARVSRCLSFLGKHLERKDKERHEAEKWMHTAAVMDRAFLIVFIAISILETVVLFLPAWLVYNRHADEHHRN